MEVFFNIIGYSIIILGYIIMMSGFLKNKDFLFYTYGFLVLSIGISIKLYNSYYFNKIIGHEILIAGLAITFSLIFGIGQIFINKYINNKKKL